MISIVSATSIGNFQYEVDDIQIYQTCNNCTYCNFTRVMGINNQTILSNLVANNDGTYYYYNILKENFTKLGTYTYCYDCGNTAEKETGCINFNITYTGEELDLTGVIIYITAIGILIFLFILILGLIDKLPSQDSVSNDGDIIQVTQLKHLRPFFWSVNWLIVLVIVFILSNLGLAYLNNSMIGDLFFNMYQILFWCTIIIYPLWYIKIFTDIWKDNEVKKIIERGGDVKRF